MTYFFLFFKRNDILVDVIIFAKDKAENQKKFCKRKMEENMAVISLIIGGVVAIMQYLGGVDYLLENLTKKIKSKK